MAFATVALYQLEIFREVPTPQFQKALSKHFDHLNKIFQTLFFKLIFKRGEEMQDKNAGFHQPKPVVMMFYMKMQINVDCMLTQNGFVRF